MRQIEFGFSPEGEKRTVAGPPLTQTLFIADGQSRGRVLAAESPRGAISARIPSSDPREESREVRKFQKRLMNYRTWRGIQWRRLINNTLLLHEGLTMAAQELGKPASCLNYRNIVKDKYRCFGSGIRGLYDILPAEKDKLDYLLKLAGIEMTPEDFDYATQHQQEISWPRVSGETVRYALEKLASQMGVRPSLINAQSIQTVPIQDFNNYTLAGLYRSTLDAIRDSGTPEINPMSAILERAGLTITLEDIQTLPSRVQLPLNRIPPETYRAIVENASDVPFLFWTRRDFRKKMIF